MASRRVQWSANVLSSIRFSSGGLPDWTFEPASGERLGADEGQLDLGIGQEDQVLVRVLDVPEALVGGAGLPDADAWSRPATAGRPAPGIGPEPVVAAGQFEGRRRGRRRELVAEIAPAPPRPSRRLRGLPSAVRSRTDTAFGRRRSFRLRPQDQRLAPAADEPFAPRWARPAAGRSGPPGGIVRREARAAGRRRPGPSR